jgi:glycosyltransferase involved in cell wall biosynthesis
VELKIIGHPQKNFLGLNIPNDLLGQPDVSFTGYLSDAQLVRHYQHALGFVYPSFEEGFGLPIVESFHAGCPVITSNASCLPEVAGDAALFVDPYDTVSISSAMMQLVESPNLQAELVQKGQARQLHFSWTKAAQEIHDLMKGC